MLEMYGAGDILDADGNPGDNEVAMLALRLGKYSAALMVTFAFLFGHMIPFGAKHQAALRTAMM